jgi:hypothetical protein
VLKTPLLMVSVAFWAACSPPKPPAWVSRGSGLFRQGPKGAGIFGIGHDNVAARADARARIEVAHGVGLLMVALIKRHPIVDLGNPNGRKKIEQGILKMAATATILTRHRRNGRISSLAYLPAAIPAVAIAKNQRLPPHVRAALLDVVKKAFTVDRPFPPSKKQAFTVARMHEVHLATKRKQGGAPQNGMPSSLERAGVAASTDNTDKPDANDKSDKPQPQKTTAAKPVSKPIIAVFDIEDSGAGLPAKTLRRFSDYLASQLAASGRFQVVPRAQLQKQLSGQRKKSYKSCYEQSCQIEIGKQLAAQKSLATKLIKLGGRCTVTAVVYSLKRSTSEGGATAKGHCSEAALLKLVDRIVEQLASPSQAS